MALRDSLKTLGLPTTLSYLAARATAGRTVVGWHRYRVVAVPRTGMPAVPRGFEVRQVSADELKTFVIDAPASVQQARFGQGLACLAAFEAGSPVGVNWMAKGEFDEDEVNLRYVIPADAAWDTGLWIRPDRRFSRAFAALWAGTGVWLDEQRLARSMSRIADYNLASLNAHRRMGAVEAGVVAALRIGGWQFVTGAEPRCSRASGRPAVLDLRGR